MMNSLSNVDSLGLLCNPIRWSSYATASHECKHKWRYGKMEFHTPSGVDLLSVHACSLRLQRSEIVPARARNESELPVCDARARFMSEMNQSSIWKQTNLEDYLCNGLTIVSRLPDVNTTTTQFISIPIARTLAVDSLRAIVDLGSIYCGEGVREILSVVGGDVTAGDHNIEAAIQSHLGRAVAASLARVCRRVAAEYDAVATILSLDEASDYLLTRFLGRGRIVELAKLLLNTANLLHEDTHNIMVVTRGLAASMRSFSFVWNDAVVEARQLIDTAKSVLGTGNLQDVDFWDVVGEMSRMLTQPRIALDAVVAIAMAELGFVVKSSPNGMSVLRAVAGNAAAVTTKFVALTNHATVWISPFRALTEERVVMALDGRTTIRMIDEVSGVSGTVGIFEKCTYTGEVFLCCEPLPYFHIKEIKSNMPKAFAALASDNQGWTDGLETALRELSSKKVPLDGIEVDAAVSTARDSYAQNVRLAGDCVRLIFSVKRMSKVFTLSLEQGRRMGDVLYQYSLHMVHPDVTRVGNRTVREVWENLEEVEPDMRRFLENVRLTYEGWMVYPETGSAGMRHMRRRYTHHSTVWLGCVTSELVSSEVMG